MEIKKGEVMSRVTAESVAMHYYSTPASGRDSHEVKRVPMVLEGRYGLVDVYWQEGAELVLSRMRGWSERGELSVEMLKLSLRSGYTQLEEAVRKEIVEMLVSAVWGRIAGQQYPEIATSARERYERAEDRLVCMMRV